MVTKRSADQHDAEDELQRDKKKCTEPELCTPFCEPNCPFRGEHNELILSLVNLHESPTTSLDQWKAVIKEAKEKHDFSQPIPDPIPNFRYPLLHWAAVLGKVKAVKWLLQEGYVDLNNNPGQPMSTLPNVSNRMVLFSTARWIHDGVQTRETADILNVFTNILDAFLKHDPDVLLAQEGNGTVLHLCALGEEGSNAPFFAYLKRILGKLQEYSEKNDKLPLKEILKAVNKAGDTFLHFLAKSHNREEAGRLIDYATDKFPQQFLKEIRNGDRKTVDEILKEPFQPDPEVYQTGSQENECYPSYPLGVPDEDLNRSLRNRGHMEQLEIRALGPDGSNNGREREIGGEDVEVPNQESSPQFGDQIVGEVLFPREQPREGPSEDLYDAGITSQVQSATLQPVDTESGIRDSLQRLIDKEESELQEKRRTLKRLCEEKKKIEAEVQNLATKVEAHKKAMSNLV